MPVVDMGMGESMVANGGWHLQILNPLQLFLLAPLLLCAGILGACVFDCFSQATTGSVPFPSVAAPVHKSSFLFANARTSALVVS